jgi:DhnA family fructose-bisphosphate aldolase class Ia
MPYLDDDRWLQLINTRAEQPHLAVERLRTRRRRTLLTDGRLFIVAADHTARGMLGVPGDPFAMADRRRMLEALLVALDCNGCDGVLGSADVIEDLALLGALDGKLAFGTMNRGGITGASWELDDRMTAYSAAALASYGLDGGKVLLRLADDDAGTAPTLEACARAVDECAAAGLPIMVEPLPYHHDPTTGAAKLLDDDDALLRAVAVASGLGATSTATWLKVPAGRDPQRMLSCTTLPALILGGTPGPDPEASYAAWERAMDVPNVRGLVVGRALLFPPDGDVAGAIERAAAIVRRDRVQATRR